MAVLGGKSGEGRKITGGRIVRVTLSAVFVLLLTIGLAGIVIYKSGEMSIKASVDTQAPQMQADENEVKKIRESLEYANSVAWQDGWVAYDGKVYEYRENTLNFLFLGIDRNGKLSSETKLSNWKAGQADAIFLLSLNQDDKTISFIGIPRNSMVDVEIFNSEEKRIDIIHDAICLQYPYAGGGVLGLEKMKESVSELFGGLPIHGACAVSNGAVSEVMSRLDGIEVVLPDDVIVLPNKKTGDDVIYSPRSAHLPTNLKGAKYYKKGDSLTVTDENVNSYLRYRDSYMFGAATARLTRQKEFMKSAAARIMEEIKANPAFVSDIYESVRPYMNTDITLDKAVYIAVKAVECRLSEQSFYQLTGEEKENYIEDANVYYDEYYLDEEDLKKVMIEVFYKEVKVVDYTGGRK